MRDRAAGAAGTTIRAPETECLGPLTQNTLQWHLVRSDDKRKARLNCISHLLRLIPYKKVPREKVELPKHAEKHGYDDQKPLEGHRFITERY